MWSWKRSDLGKLKLHISLVPQSDQVFGVLQQAVPVVFLPVRPCLRCAFLLVSPSMISISHSSLCLLRPFPKVRAPLGPSFQHPSFALVGQPISTGSVNYIFEVCILRISERRPYRHRPIV